MWKKGLYKKGLYKKAGILVLLLVMLSGLSIIAMAENLSCRTAKATGFYEDPVTGQVEDSGGEDNKALGASMVSNVVDSTALIEKNPSGGYYVSLRFHLMDNLSDICFEVRQSESDSFRKVESKETGSDGEQADFRLPVETEDSVIRATCYVEAMGRNVVFFVTLSDFTEGNEGGFAQMASQSGDDVLDGVTGLTTGGSASATLVTSNEPSETIESQQLNLSAGVWWMLFVVVFCANILAGLVLFGAKTLIVKMLDRNVDTDDESEEESDENDLEYTELSESDWEDLKGEEEE